MKIVYVIESVSIRHVPENSNYFFAENILCTYNSNSYSDISLLSDKIKKAKFIEVNKHSNNCTTISFAPSCKDAELIVDNIEQIILTIKCQSKKLVECQAENDRLYTQVTRQNHEVKELKHKCTQLKNELDLLQFCHNALNVRLNKEYGLKESFIKRLIYLFFPNHEKFIIT